MEATLSSTTHPEAHAAPASKRIWIGRVLSGLVVVFMTMDGVMKLVMPAPVVEAFARTGFPVHLGPTLGLLALGCVALYLIPRTAVLGAVLLTAFLGGAVETHLRLEDPLFSHVLTPVYMAALAWGGLFLRDERVRALAPWRR